LELAEKEDKNYDEKQINALKRKGRESSKENSKIFHYNTRNKSKAVLF
jgi:hypothetical protein